MEITIRSRRRARMRIMSGLTPQMNPPRAFSADMAPSVWVSRRTRLRPGHRPRLRPSPVEDWTVDEVGNEIDAAIVLTEVADLKQARMRHLQRAGFEKKPRPDGAPMRLVVALQHANRDRDAERAMRAEIHQAAQPPATDQSTKLIA